MSLRRAALLLPCLVAGACAHAIDMATYEAQRRARPDILKIHVLGVGEGLTWAQVISASSGNKRFFCPPQTPLEADNYMALIEVEAAHNPSVTRYTEIGYVLFLALQRAYPCAAPPP